VNRLGSTLGIIACGMLGAALAGVLVLLVPMDDSPIGYGARISNELPVFVFATVIGFVIGVSISLLWSMLQWIFATDTPRP
jgi:thiamine transporter ThiT